MLLALLFAAAQTPAPSPPEPQLLRVPAHSAYHDDSTPEVEQLALWFGRLGQPGELRCSIELKYEAGPALQLELSALGQARQVELGASDGLQRVEFGAFQVAAPGYQRWMLALPKGADPKLAPELVALVLEGPALKAAHFNLKPRRNAASVHLAYPIEEAEVAAFYCEVTAEEDPLWSYYMATGWQRGYFGMQVNGPGERRIIFSVWDSSAEAVDREKVPDADRVQLVARGDKVVTGSFGNEGTGGHSHLVFDWKTGETQRFLVTAKADDETHTTFTGYYFRRDLDEWMLISSWRAPKEGRLMRGLYSFSENFSGRNGHLLRRARYGKQWVLSPAGKWREQTRASFSHDGTGKADRLDRFMGLAQGEFFLSHGGFVAGQGKFGEVFEREPLGERPGLPKLPADLIPKD